MSQPKISVVTPVFNQVDYIEETLDSVLSQGVDGVEYIVLDGGSTDGTAEIIRRYERHLSFWRSAPDGGQSHAIAEGFQIARGRVLCWLNGDDYFMPGVLKKVIRAFEKNVKLHLFYGDYIVVDENGKMEGKLKVSYDFDICLHAYLMIPQPSSFWTRSVYDAVGGINTDFDYAFDWDFFLRVGRYLRGEMSSIHHEHDLFSVFRLHAESKSVSARDRFKEERKKIQHQFEEYRKVKFREIAKIHHLIRVLLKYHRERQWIPTGKDKRKA